MKVIEYSHTMAMKKENKFFKIIFNLIKSFLFSCLLTFLLALALGFSPILVVGRSMEPVINYHDIIFIKKVSQEEIQVGDIVMFTLREGNIPCTHRVVDIADGGFLTKGESENAAIDNQERPLSYSQIDGKVIFSLPWIGNLLLYLAVTSNLVTIVLSLPFLYLFYSKFHTINHDVFAEE